jgi:hypothetical protein
MVPNRVDSPTAIRCYIENDACAREVTAQAPAKTGHFAARADPQIVTVLAQTDATLLWVNDLFEDEIHFNQNPSQQGIFLKQRVHVVAVFVAPK